MKLISSRRSLAALAAVMAVTTVVGSGTAAVADETEVQVIAVNADIFEIIGDTLILTNLNRTCSITAQQPVRSANTVRGTAAVTCNRNYSLLTLQVCVQMKQSVADDQGALWQTLTCNPKKQARNEDHLSDTHVASCVAGPQYYRTWVEATGFTADDPNNPAMTATIAGPRILLDCFL